MMRKSTKNVAQVQRNALLCKAAGELTCSESQVDDVLSAGESTKEERPLPTELIHQRAGIPVRR